MTTQDAGTRREDFEMIECHDQIAKAPINEIIDYLRTCEIRTGYFAKINYYVSPVSIARKTPNWAQWIGPAGKTRIPEISCLAPSPWLLNQWTKSEKTESDWGEHKNLWLYALDCGREMILKRLAETAFLKRRVFGSNGLSSRITLTLCCWEKTGEHCHRNIVAEWLRAQGIPCEEDLRWRSK
jgi:hypothetical protein